jgi:16S rRNA (adenine1518-N6/adenine1519-N6)-dimethyltransferase
VTAAAFGQRRKMLRSSLKQVTAMPELLLRKADISPERRAEELTVTDFARLACALDRNSQHPT